jgi:hypothetical protein
MKAFNLKQFIIQTLRRASYRYPARNAVLKKARVSRGQYECIKCGPGKTYDRHSISVDHLNPVVDPEKGFTTFDEYISRMFCEESGFQVLCDEHHTEKTQGENAVRKRTRAERNKDRRVTYRKKKIYSPSTNKHTGQELDDFLKECGIELPKSIKKNKKRV